MTLIKLDAIDSTNSFLKQLVMANDVENYTTVVAENQTKGKGQMDAVWVSEKGKNLIMSVFVKDLVTDINQIFTLNVAVAISIIEVLQNYNIPDLCIKWPNDIMSANKKIAGILIENSFKSDGKIQSIIGIGVNVNQEQFEGFPNASSLRLVSGHTYDIQGLLAALRKSMQDNTQKIHNQNPGTLWISYHSHLFKKGLPTVFEIDNNQKIMGIIQGVNLDGTLRLLLEDDTIRHFGIKQIKMLF